MRFFKIHYNIVVTKVTSRESFNHALENVLSYALAEILGDSLGSVGIVNEYALSSFQALDDIIKYVTALNIMVDRKGSKIGRAAYPSSHEDAQHRLRAF